MAAGGRSDAAMLEHTRALEQTMAANKDPKFQNSKFLQFLSKMTRGEVILEDNQVLLWSIPARSCKHAPCVMARVAAARTL